MKSKNNFYYLELYDLKIIIDSLEILHKQMGMYSQLGIETPYSKEDVEMILEILKSNNAYNS